MYNAYLEHGCPQPCTSVYCRRGTRKNNKKMCEAEVSLNKKYIVFTWNLNCPPAQPNAIDPPPPLKEKGSEEEDDS